MDDKRGSKAAGEERGGGREGASGCRCGCGGLVATVLVVLAILLVTVWAIARTEGFRRLAQERISRWTGMEWVVGATGWRLLGCEVTARDVEGRYAWEESAGKREGRLRVREVRYRPGWGGRARLVLVGPRVEIAEGEGGEWHPAFLGSLGGIRGPDDVVLGSRSIRERMIIELRDATVTWFDRRGWDIVSAVGLYGRMWPIRFPERGRCWYYAVRSQSLVGGEQPRYDARTAWLSGEGVEGCVVLESDDGAGGQFPWRLFWRERPSLEDAGQNRDEVPEGGGS